MQRRTLLQGLLATTLIPLLARPAGAQERLSFSYGWDADVAGPEQADVYVSPTGDDAAPGTITAPVRSIQRGVDLLARLPGGSLSIRGGTYREFVSLERLRGTAAAPFRIHRHGRERVTITAADPLTGWQPVSADEAAAQGLPDLPLWSARLPRAALEHGAPQALNLHERGAWRPLAVDRADTLQPQRDGDQTTYHPGQFMVDTANHILAIRDARLIGRSPAQMREVRVLVYHYPNAVSAVDIADFDAATGTLTLADQSLEMQVLQDQPITRYALQNDPAALTPGHWIARSGTQGEVTVYFAPVDPDALDSGIEISVRTGCIDFGRARHVELFGLEVIRAAGVGWGDGMCIARTHVSAEGPETLQALSLRHCRVGESMAAGVRGFGPLSLSAVRGLRVHNLTVDRAYGSFGMSFDEVTDADLRYVHVTQTAHTPARFFGLRRAVFAFSLLEDSAWAAHANKVNFYEGSDTVLVYGIRARNVGGYATFQKASRINFAFCELPCEPASYNRALVSQNFADGREEPVAQSDFYYWNNTLRAQPGALTPANALQLGPGGTRQTHHVFNSILHGGGFDDIYTDGSDPAREVRSHNRYTGLSFWQAPHYGWQLGWGEQQIAPARVPRGGGRDMRDVISTLAPLFAGFTDWNVDINGDPVSWEAAPIGCEV